MWEPLWPLLMTNVSVLLVIMLVLWGFSLGLRDVSFVDAFWPLGFVIVGGISASVGEAPEFQRALLFGFVTLWGLRLAIHLGLRWLRQGPDPRYTALIDRQKMNPKLFTLVYVFIFQGLLISIISLPLQMGAVATGGAEQINIITILGSALFLTGFFFETVGDWQLSKFRTNPSNRGKVLDSGLWRYTRHPNYFGDICVFWGLYVIAAGSELGAWSFPGPALLTFILMKWSGVPLLERNLKTTRPGYEEYVRTTSALFPWPPRRHNSENELDTGGS